MAKLSVVLRNEKRRKQVANKSVTRAQRREEARAVYNSPDASLEERMKANEMLQRIPRDANPVRIRKRCSQTGRPRGNNFTGVSRIELRKLICEGFVPGVTKSSW
jgi:small subunit ribosomal protein S14